MIHSVEEEKALDISHNAIRRWYQPSGVMLGFLLIAIVVAYQFASIHRLIQDNADAAITAKHVADIAADDAYHNCVITRALEEWSKALGTTNPVLSDRDEARRNAIYRKLHDTLQVVDGIVCTKPADYEKRK